MIAAHADSGHRQVEPWQQATLRGFSMGVMVTVLLGGVLMLFMVPYGRTTRVHAGASVAARAEGSPETARRLRAFRDEARLSLAEERQVRTLLSDARDTRAAAVAYFGAIAEAERTSGGADNAAEIDEVVDGTIRARLIEAVGESRAALAERHLGPFATFVAKLR